jgi:hypothetical protein
MASHMANTTHSGLGTRLTALLVASLLLLEPAVPLYAMVDPDIAPPKGLQIVILDGEGALNNIKERTAREPIVQVQDENHKPLTGAAVLFAIHGGAGGAGGSFAGGASSLSVVTDANGVARAAGLTANSAKGSWQIQVTAKYGNLQTSTTINESNVSPPSNPQNKPQKPQLHWGLSQGATIAAAAAAVAAAVVVAVVVTNSSSSGTKITTGGGTVGPPTSSKAEIRFRF